MASIVIKIRVDNHGLPEKFGKFDSQIPPGLLPAWVRIANILEKREMSMTPVRTGLLRATIQTNARILGVDSIASAVDPRNGFNYARIQHDGGFASGKYGPHMIRGKFYMTIPLMESPSYTIPALDARISQIIAMCGLK